MNEKSKEGTLGCLLWLQVQTRWAAGSARSHHGLGWRGRPAWHPDLLPVSPVLFPQSLRPFSTLDLMTPILGVAPEHTRQLLLEGPVRVKEGREGKVRARVPPRE